MKRAHGHILTAQARAVVTGTAFRSSMFTLKEPRTQGRVQSEFGLGRVLQR